MDKRNIELLKMTGFESKDNVVYQKNFSDYVIKVNVDTQTVDFGNKIIVDNEELTHLENEKDFILVECVSRLLDKGYFPQNIMLDGKDGSPDIMVGAICIYCVDKEDYLKKSKDFNNGNYSILYNSEVSHGKVIFNNIVVFEEERYSHGLFEDDVPTFVVSPSDKII